MGNSGSSANSENEEEEPAKEQSDNNGKETSENIANLDLIVLFEPSDFRRIANNIKEEPPLNLLQQHHAALIRWLDERRSRGAETVSLIQFVDSFPSKAVEREVVAEIFKQFDIDDDGIIDLDYLHEMLDISQRSGGGFIGVRSDLKSVNKLLQDCSLAPGFIDAFTTNKTVQDEHGRRLFKYIFRNRACSSALSLSVLKGFFTTTEMRQKVLNAHLKALKERADNKKREPPLQADEILKPINRCFTSAEVSSNRNEASKLLDNDTSTFWQSDGPARSHWVRLTIPPNVVIKQLSMYVLASDQSYMPNHVVIYGGRDEMNLRELNDVKIPVHITGDFTLLENQKVPYQVIKIAIKRCHSDGCDTRVRQIKAIGYRVVKSKGVSLVDATAMWYLSVLASTAEATLPLAPHLRQQIIAHTRASLSHMEPLSLSSTSSEKPGFLSNNVMEQMELFLHRIIGLRGSPDPEELIVLLEYAFVRGSLGSVLDVLKLILGNIEQKYPAVVLLRSLSETEENSIRKHGSLLSVSLVSCDGGAKDGKTAPGNVLCGSSDVYCTASGKTHFNMAFSLKNSNMLQLTKLYTKFISKGGMDPKAVMVFVCDAGNIKDESGEEIFRLLEKFDTWIEEDYKRYKESAREESECRRKEPYSLVAYFTVVDKDRTDVEIPVDVISSGNCIVVKFMGARDVNAERIGISQIDFYGFELNDDDLRQQNSLNSVIDVLPADEEADVSGLTVFFQSLRFLKTMSSDPVMNRPPKELSFEKEPKLDADDITVTQLWNIYVMLNSSHSALSEKHRSTAIEILLTLFHAALPHLRPSSQKVRYRKLNNIKKLKKSYQDDKNDKQTNDVSSVVFQSLCEIVDNEEMPSGVHKLAKAIILDGAEVFFPDAQSRRDHLLSLVDEVMEDGKAVSLSYTFESLCRFFSNKDASGLLGLPEQKIPSDFNAESVVHVMKTLVSVAYRECIAQMNEENGPDNPSNLVSLLSAMQKSVMAWCLYQCNNIADNKDVAASILLQYIELISNRCKSVLGKLINVKDKVRMVDRLEFSFVSITMRQLILLLNTFSSFDISSIKLLAHLKEISSALSSISFALPEFFTNGLDFSSGKKNESVMLREWELESEHDYGNNMNFIKVFSCPGCTSFRVEFDEKCKTEKSYDYLEFTDSMGVKKRFDHVVNTEKWPQVVTFQGQKLHFLFHSDGSNTAWGYRFKVFAVGSPDVAFSWIFDLQLNLAKCFGLFCGTGLNVKKAFNNKSSSAEDGDERALLHSELWSSLFRGGYLVGKLERSLSGFHSSNPSHSAVNVFLNEVASSSSERARQLLEQCRKQYVGQVISNARLLESCVNAIFAALLWHTQELREQVADYLNGSFPAEFPPSILHAYKTAESVRRSLMERRQRLLMLEEDALKDESETKNKVTDPDMPAISCREKALFLLKFAGLTKMMSRKLSSHMLERRTSTVGKKNSRLVSRQESIEAKRNISSHTMMETEPPFTEKFPYFQLILDFVLNESLSHEKIHSLLQQRCKYAKNVASIYNFACDYITQHSCSNTISVPVLLFLQNALLSQDDFPQHYADCLNGCGLELENHVRKAFYSFIQKLVNIVVVHSANCSYSSSQRSSMLHSAQVYLLHFTDIDWKPYDYKFLINLQLPSILLNFVHGTIIPSKVDEEEAEVEMYKRHKRYFQQAKAIGIDAWCDQNRLKAQVDVQRDINLFIARYSANLEVVITCDGCSEKIRGRRYRCLHCIDMDLCTSCYNSGRKPSEHLESHEVIDLRFTCDGCDAFIVETRFHCTVCPDFNLCLGCYRSGKYPACHKTSHQMTRSNLISGGLFPSATSHGASLLTYIHHHSWLQFSAIALSLSDWLRTWKKQGAEKEYMDNAAKLLVICLRKLVDYLKTPTETKELDCIDNALGDKEKRIQFDNTEKVIDISSVSDDFNATKKVYSSSNQNSNYTESQKSIFQINASADDTLRFSSAPKSDISNSESNIVNPEDSYFNLHLISNIENIILSNQGPAGIKVEALNLEPPPMPSLEGEHVIGKGGDENDESGRTFSEINSGAPVSVPLEVSGILKIHSRQEETVDHACKDSSKPYDKFFVIDHSTATSEVNGDTVSNSILLEKLTEENTDSVKDNTNKKVTPESRTNAERNTSDEACIDESERTVPSETLTENTFPADNNEDKVLLMPQTDQTLTESQQSNEMVTSYTTATNNQQDSSQMPVCDLGDLSCKVPARDDATMETKDHKANKEIIDEISFGLLVRRKNLGLLSAVIPVDEKASSFLSVADFSNFVSRPLIPTLISILKESKPDTVKLKMVIMGVLSKTLFYFGVEIGDRGVANALEINSKSTQPGSRCVKFLFEYGAECLESGDMDVASGVENVLSKLSRSEQWKGAIGEHLSYVLQELKENKMEPSLNSLFSMLYLAGFPMIYRVGTVATIKDIGSETKDVLLLNYTLEKNMVPVVNFRNRKEISIKTTSLEPPMIPNHVFDNDRFLMLLQIVKNLLQQTEDGQSSVEYVWLTSVILKSLLNMIRNGVSKDSMVAALTYGVFPLIIGIACQGTGFSKDWLLRDLEVLGLMLYRRAEVTKDLKPEGDNIEGSRDDSAKEEGAMPIQKLVQPPLDGLDSDTILCMETIHDALNCPFHILRAIYEHNGKDKEKLLEEVQRWCFNSGESCYIKPSDEILAIAKQWEGEAETLGTTKQDKEAEVVDSSIDLGVLKFQPLKKVEFDDLHARPESGEIPNKLIASLTEAEINETRSRQTRMKSNELLKKELENKEAKNDRKFLYKVKYAVAVSYARNLVGWLFSNSPPDENIMLTMLENLDAPSIVGLLDLIQRTDSKEHFQKVVFNFIRCCSKQLVQPLALAAVHCMGEVRLATETRESEHKYKNNEKIEKTVHIPGATSLFVRFDGRCSTEYNCDELIMSSSGNYQQNRRTFSGSTDWVDFEMPGDTIYYKFTSDKSNNEWGWKFTVTGGQLGRFETGCAILTALLAQDLQFARSLPLKQLWSWLVVVACNQVGQQRLMATGLLLRILQISVGDKLLFGEDVEPAKERPNLKLLKPLWNLYTNTIQSDTGTSLALVSPVIRGLSELFLVVENVAQEWGEADDLVAGLAPEEKMKLSFTKVVKNIAAIGLAINVPNKALEMLQKAKDHILSRPHTENTEPAKIRRNRPMSTIELRITGGDGTDESDSDLYDGFNEDDDGEGHDDILDDTLESDSGSDLSHPELPPL